MRCTNKMTKKPFKVLSTTAMAAALATSALVPAAVFAAEDNVNLSVSDYIVEKDGQLYSVDTATFLEMKAGKVAPTPKFVKTAAGKVYDLNDYLEAKSSNIGATMQDALELLAEDQSLEKDVTYGNVEIGEDGTPIYKPAPPTDLKVETVSAINATIASGVATDLKFAVNGTEELTKAEFEEKYEGYTAAFLFNKTTGGGQTFDKVTGKVTATDTFKYAVEVSKDGEKVNTATAADFVEVKVEAATKAVKVNEVGLVTSKAGATKFPHSSVVKNEAAFIVATEFQNALGQTNKDKKENGDPVVSGFAAPAVKSAVSDQPTVAYYDVENGITVLKDGKVTFTVEFDGIKEKSTITVDVKAKQELTSLQAVNKKVANTDTGVNLGIKFFDQDGEELHSAPTVYYTSTLAGKNEGVATTTAPDSFATEGKYTVNVYKTAGNKDKIGSLTIESVKVDADATITDYTLVYPKDAEDNAISELDVNPLLAGDDAKDTLTITAEGLIEDVKVPLAKGKDLIAKSSNDKIVKVTNVDQIVNKANGEINLEAVAAGEVTITLYTVEGDLQTAVATKTVNVKNSAPQVDTLTLKKDTKVDAKATNLEKAVVDAVAEKIVAEQIEKVTTVAANGIVIVEFKAAFGGKEFTLDAKFDDAALTDASAVLVKAASTEVTPATADVLLTALAEGNVLTVEAVDYTLPAVFDLEALNTAIVSTDVVATEDAGTVTLTKADGLDFTYSVVTPGTNDVDVVEVTTADNGTEAIPGPLVETTEDVALTALVEDNVLTVGDKSFAIPTGFSVDALTDLNSAISSTGVVASKKDASNITLTKADGSVFTYSVVTPGAPEVNVAGATVSNGTEASEGAIVSGEVTFTFTEAVALAAEGVADVSINGTIAGTAAISEDGKTVVITLTDAASLPTAEQTVSTVSGLKAANGSDLVIPTGEDAIKFTASVTGTPAQ